MSNSSGGRESPSSTASSATAGSGSVIGSVGSGSNNGCRNSGASFDSGRATSTTYQGVRYSAGGLSSESSLGSFRHSYHSSSSSLGSIPSEEIRNFDVAMMISQGLPDHEILNAWLTGIHLECYYQNFIQAGYDMHTVSRMTPEDLNAIGVTKPHHRKKIKSEISQLNISEGLPDYVPESIEEWLRLLKLDEYLPRLLDQGYCNVRQVTTVTWEDLDDIGILKLGHQKKFMLAIKRVQDILSGKRQLTYGILSSVVGGNTYLSSSVDSFPLSHHPPFRHLSMPYSQSTSPTQPVISQDSNSGCGGGSNFHHHHHHPLSSTDVRQQILQRNMWPQSAYHHHHQNPPPPPTISSSPYGVGVKAISHQIQVHHPPSGQNSEGVANSSQNQKSAVHCLYNPEVVSIRVRNGHSSNPLDSPPDEPIYGTSSFLPSSNLPQSNPSNSSSSSWSSNHRNSFRFKSFEEGETSPSSMMNGYSTLTKQPPPTANTWTLPRLQKHKPISKVMGGGMSNSCDSSGVYAGSLGGFTPQQVTPPMPPPPMVSTFGKGEYASIKVQPPPPPRRSSCSSVSSCVQYDEDNLPLPPPPPVEDELQPVSYSASSHMQTGVVLEGPPRSYGAANNSLYGQRPAAVNSTYHNHNPFSMHSAGGGVSAGGSTVNRPMMMPPMKPRDPSPVGSDIPDGDLLSNNNCFFNRGVKRNGSDASFKSTSSTESESIPFANDNAGTIKQQKPVQRNQNSLNGGGESAPPQQDGEPIDVLSDIGSMLADLTDQLDAILEQEKTVKR